jgi:hypothetical protein
VHQNVCVPSHASLQCFAALFPSVHARHNHCGNHLHQATQRSNCQQPSAEGHSRANKAFVVPEQLNPYKNGWPAVVSMDNAVLGGGFVDIVDKVSAMLNGCLFVVE